MSDKTKYKIGDQVRVVNYGHRFWKYVGDNKTVPVDIRPEYIGETGIITSAEKSQDIDKYSISGTSKSSPFYNDQLELIYRPEYK